MSPNDKEFISKLNNNIIINNLELNDKPPKLYNPTQIQPEILSKF